MAGYTAADNLMGFMYASVNAVTQACMSFTSQNYGVGNYKRMDKVLLDCMVLSVTVAVVMGSCFWFFGPQILLVYTNHPEVIAHAMEIMSITVMPYFLCGIMDLFPGALRGMGHSGVPMILSVIGTVGSRIIWIFGAFPLKFLFVCYPGSWAVTIILQVVCFWFVRKKVHQNRKTTF